MSAVDRIAGSLLAIAWGNIVYAAVDVYGWFALLVAFAITGVGLVGVVVVRQDIKREREGFYDERHH